MDRGERISAIQRVARTLSEKSLVDADLTLQEFGFPVADLDYYNGLYDYAVAQVRQGEDQALADIDSYLHPSQEPVPSFQATDDDSPWKPGSFRLFVSHTTAQKRRAGNLATALDTYGVHCFVAHDTIEPTREWQDEIEKALRSCDALCAILTADFVSSRWCDQEVGMVVAQRKLIVPLKVGSDPHGFIGKYQAITVDPGGSASAYAVADNVLRALVRSRLTAESIAPAVSRRYAQSWSFDAARAGFDLLTLIPRDAWTPEMIDRVDRAPQDNDQIEHGVLGDGSGRPIPDAANELLVDLRPAPEPPAPGDDDIPF
jgi:hypothetical protein